MEDIRRQSANTMAALGQATTSSNKLLSSIGATAQGQAMQERAQRTKEQQQKYSMLTNYLNMQSKLGAKAQADKKEQFEAKAAAISALKAAGRQNRMAAIKEGSALGLKLATGGFSDLASQGSAEDYLSATTSAPIKSSQARGPMSMTSNKQRTASDIIIPQ
jgi:hypothetical protein